MRRLEDMYFRNQRQCAHVQKMLSIKYFGYIRYYSVVFAASKERSHRKPSLILEALMMIFIFLRR